MARLEEVLEQGGIGKSGADIEHVVLVYFCVTFNTNTLRWVSLAIVVTQWYFRDSKFMFQGMFSLIETPAYICLLIKSLSEECEDLNMHIVL